MLESFNEGTFAPLLNTEFTLHPGEAGTVKLELVEVNGDGAHKVPGVERFSLVFRGPLGAPLAQRTYPMEHERTGPFELFIVPVKKDAAGYYYEAIFSRLVGQS